MLRERAADELRVRYRLVPSTRAFGLITLGLSLFATACADPYADAPTPGQPPPAARELTGSPAQDAHPLHGRIAGGAQRRSRAAAPEVPAAVRSPATLARTYASLALNWDWRDLPAQLAALRPLTAGTLSHELVHAVEATRSDETLARDRPASRAAVVAVSSSGGGATRRLVVVTRVREPGGAAALLAPATHEVYLGQARRIGRSWRMVKWRQAP